MAKQTLIDLKAEMIIAKENVEEFHAIKAMFLSTMKNQPHGDANHVFQSILQHNEIKQNDFNFIAGIEDQYYRDLYRLKK